MEMTGWTWGRVAKVTFSAYVLVQVVTGIEVGITAATLHLVWHWSLAKALAAAIPCGFPVMLAQGYVASLYVRDPSSGFAPAEAEAGF